MRAILRYGAALILIIGPLSGIIKELLRDIMSGGLKQDFMWYFLLSVLTKGSIKDDSYIQSVNLIIIKFVSMLCHLEMIQDTIT